MLNNLCAFKIRTPYKIYNRGRKLTYALVLCLVSLHSEMSIVINTRPAN